MRTRFRQASKSGKSPRPHFVSFQLWLMIKSAREEVHPCDSTLPTMHGVGDRRMLVPVSEEKGIGKYFEDGRGVSTVSVRIEPLIDVLDIYLCDTSARGSG